MWSGTPRAAAVGAAPPRKLCVVKLPCHPAFLTVWFTRQENSSRVNGEPSLNMTIRPFFCPLRCKYVKIAATGQIWESILPSTIMKPLFKLISFWFLMLIIKLSRKEILSVGTSEGVRWVSGRKTELGTVNSEQRRNPKKKQTTICPNHYMIIVIEIQLVFHWHENKSSDRSFHSFLVSLKAFHFFYN